jgi:hypothetical protein
VGSTSLPFLSRSELGKLDTHQTIHRPNVPQIDITPTTHKKKPQKHGKWARV